MVIKRVNKIEKLTIEVKLIAKIDKFAGQYQEKSGIYQCITNLQLSSPVFLGNNDITIPRNIQYKLIQAYASYRNNPNGPTKCLNQENLNI